MRTCVFNVGDLINLHRWFWASSIFGPWLVSKCCRLKSVAFIVNHADIFLVLQLFSLSNCNRFLIKSFFSKLWVSLLWFIADVLMEWKSFDDKRDKSLAQGRTFFAFLLFTFWKDFIFFNSISFMKEKDKLLIFRYHFF